VVKRFKPFVLVEIYSKLCGLKRACFCKMLAVDDGNFMDKMLVRVTVASE
jgi:hypothetical protein